MAIDLALMKIRFQSTGVEVKPFIMMGEFYFEVFVKVSSKSELLCEDNEFTMGDVLVLEK